jgi:hypothetical protein
VQPQLDAKEPEIEINGTIPTAGGSQSVFANFYAPGDTFGCISVLFTYPAAGG